MLKWSVSLRLTDLSKMTMRSKLLQRLRTLLFAYEEESHLCIVHHISNLCAARRRIKRRGHCTYAVAAKADVHALRLILREDGNTFLPTYAQREEGIRNAQNAR